MSETSRLSWFGLKRFHFVGIGGIGMSALAEILVRQGYCVSGSDLQSSPLIERLQSHGVSVVMGHHADHLGEAQVVVYSSAVDDTNPELKAARKRKLPVAHRSELLAELMRDRIGIAVSGTHGKTTTSSMLALMLIEAGLDPTALIGAPVEALGGNARLGGGDLLVAEADESDRSFLRLPAVCAVITNIDLDHMDVYRDLQDLQESFLQFLQQVPFYGVAVACLDDPALAAVLPRLRSRVLTYGLEQPGDIRGRDLNLKADGCTFECFHGGERLGTMRLQVPGRHNALNALAAVAVGRWLELPFGVIRDSLEKFRGADRRLHFLGRRRGVQVIDDYAHHPTEIRAALEACRLADRRLVVVFQPHRYSRTQNLMGKMGDCFQPADRLYVLDIYGAGEDPRPGVSGRQVAEEIGARRQVAYVPEFSQLVSRLRRETRPGDTLLTLGAGDVWKIGVRFLEQD